MIGAGPAGSTLAALLAGRGIDVVLIDRDRFPRDKLCGEFLSYDALPVLEPLGLTAAIEERGAPRIERCRVVGRRHTYDFDFPARAFGVSRLFLDDLLVRTAAARGARVYEGATATLLEPDAVTIAGNDAPSTVIRCRAVAGAWGRWGRFDTLLGRRFARDRTHRNFGFKRHYRALASRDRDLIELYSFRRGYLGVSGVEDGLTNICGLVHAGRLAGHKGRWDSFVAGIRAEEPHLERMYAMHEPAQDDYLSSEPVIFRARSAVEGGIFMVGDAAGIVDPLTGNGMAMSIQSSLLAAKHLLRLLERPGERPAVEAAYRDEHRALFAPRIRWSRSVASLLSRPRALDFALATSRSPRLGEILLRHTRASRESLDRLVESWF